MMTGISGSPRDAADRAAIDRFRAGDREGGVGELFRRYGPQTYGFFARRTGDREVAAELNQELYLAVVRALPAFRGESSFRTWLFRMAHNELSNLRRRWRTHLDERTPDVPDELWEQIGGATEEDPGTLMDDARQSRALLRCLAALPENERAVVIGQYYQGETLAALTERLGLSNASGARALLIAAQRRIKRCLTARKEAS